MKLPMPRNPVRSLFLLTAFALLVFSLSGRASAQTVQQTITLRPGWNAVFLEVEPQNTACATVFQGLPVESVWMWNPRNSFVEYIQNPNQLKPKDPEWLAWFSPTLSYNALLTNLFHIMGERAYLIKVTGAANVTWTIVGAPKLPRITWKPNSPNLVGFHLRPGQEPTFATFFTPSDAHRNAAPQAYRLDAAGTWGLTPATAQMKSGEAYWIQCDTASEYTGPLAVNAKGGGIDFGKMAVEESLSLQNLTGQAMTISITPQASAPATPPINGMVPLSYWVSPSATNQNPASVGWLPLTGAIALTYGAGEAKDLRLAVRRTALPGPGSYLSLLNITNNAGMRVFVPVTTGEEVLTKTAKDSDAGAKTDGPPDRTGLWVGTVNINAVNEPADGSDPATPKPTASELTFRIMLHVDATGTVRLLREVAQLWKEDDERVVLFTNHKLLTAALASGNYSGAGLRDGQAVGRRISCAAYSFATCDAANPPNCLPQLNLSGSFTVGATLSGAYTVGSDDPLNPFKHKYHPDHDNLNADFDPNAKIEEAYEFSRAITLELTANDPTNLSLAQPGWGDTTMGGIYQETISGVHRDPLHIKGVFRVRKISDVGQLNDGA